MYMRKVDAGTADLSLSIIELSLLAQVCYKATMNNDADQALIEALGAAFRGAGMAAGALDVLLIDDSDRVERHWARSGLVYDKNGVAYPAKTLEELRELLLDADVFVQAAHFEGMGMVLSINGEGVLDVAVGDTVISVAIDEMIAEEEPPDTPSPTRRDGIAVGKKVNVNTPEVNMMGIVEDIDENTHMILVRSTRGHAVSVTVGAEYVHLMD